jgi:hypothetical protein
LPFWQVVDDLVARHALQGDRRAKVLAHRGIVGDDDSGVTRDSGEGESENPIAAAAHGVSCGWRSKVWRTFADP